ncbi:MAG: hypothetical protein H7A23_05095 [Leptospiraceae bacterium]|nr:hypothetical protein [Leptospiraceae bacterium]MCP5493911.1 hypothetical protein [Leptospiraceae bacterium]
MIAEQNESKQTSFKFKIIQEIEQIPENKLMELYNLVHFYRIGLEQIVSKKTESINYAGCWSDMSEEDFQDFVETTFRRRRHSNRRKLYEEVFT